jgi:predicted aspartyl protease
MELYGRRLGVTRRYFVSLNIHIPQFNISKPITFLVDTGCEITTINPIDSVYNLEIYSKIVNIKSTLGSRTAAGTLVENVVLSYCGLYYYHGPNHLLQYEKLDEILVSKMEIKEENWKHVMSVPSLLGMNFLERYKIRFNESQVILER